MAEKIQSELGIGVDTSRTAADAKPYGFRVLWIPWHSGFRDTDLALDDVIVALGDKVFDPATKDFDFGGYSEQQYWEKAGAKDGDAVILTVVRDGETRNIPGKVRADRIYLTEDGKRAMASPGPESMARDGFDETWSTWDEKLVKDMQSALTAGWRRNTRQELEQLLRHAPRIQAVVERYPGPYANAMKTDFDAAVASLTGTKYDLSPDDLAYRSFGETRLRDAMELAKKSWDGYLAKAEAVELSSLPEIDPVRGDRGAVAGKLVVLPKMNEIAEAGHGWFWMQGAGRSIFLVDQRSPAFTVILRAVLRFRALITPQIGETYRLVGKVGDSPAMVAAGRQVYTGLTVEPAAALVDGKMFIDTGAGDAAKFAGEDDAKKPPEVDTRPDLPPAEVFRSFVNALKLGDNELWIAFFATWSCKQANGEYVYDPKGGVQPNSLYSEYTRARGQIMGPVYDMRVAKTSKVKLLLDRPDLRVEEVALVVDHVGLFDGEYRAFNNVNTHRDWTMQRVGGGPWRITSDRGI